MTIRLRWNRALRLLRQRAVLLLLLGGTAIAIFGLMISAPKPSLKAETERRWKVQAMVAQPELRQPLQRLYGRIESPAQAQLTAAIDAHIVAVAAQEGHSVEPEQVLIRLEQKDVLLQRAQRQSDLTDAKAKLAAEQVRYQSARAALAQEQQLLRIEERAVTRQRSLVKRQLASQTQLDQALKAKSQQSLRVLQRQFEVDDHPNRKAQLQAQIQRVTALLERTEIDLERTVVTAPFKGRVAAVDVAPGERVRVGEPLLTLYSSAELEVRVQIPSRFLPALRQALSQHKRPKAELVLDEQRWPLVYDRLAAAITANRGGVDALFRVEGPQPELELGRAVVVEALMPAVADVIAVPADAIYGGKRIYRVINGMLEALEIEWVGEVVEQNRQKLLVRSSSLQAGDNILLTHIPNAITGMAVDLEPEVPQPAATSLDEEVLGE